MELNFKNPQISHSYGLSWFIIHGILAIFSDFVACLARSSVFEITAVSLFGQILDKPTTEFKDFANFSTFSKTSLPQ